MNVRAILLEKLSIRLLLKEKEGLLVAASRRRRKPDLGVSDSDSAICWNRATILHAVSYF